MLVDGFIVGLKQLLICAPPEVNWGGFSPLPPQLRAEPAMRLLTTEVHEARPYEKDSSGVVRQHTYVPPEVIEYQAKAMAATRAAWSAAPPKLTEDMDDLVDFVPSQSMRMK